MFRRRWRGRGQLKKRNDLDPLTLICKLRSEKIKVDFQETKVMEYWKSEIIKNKDKNKIRIRKRKIREEEEEICIGERK